MVTQLVGSLQEWEHKLLKEISFLQPERTVWDALCSSRCYAASDGSAPMNQGSFGWVLSDKNGKCLVKCRGPVYGHAISSYHAEAYSMLSFLRFLTHLTDMYQTEERQAKATYLVCDNQGLVNSINKLSKYCQIIPNTTMSAEWDCLSQILQTIRQLGWAAPDVDHIEVTKMLTHLMSA